MQDGGPAGNCVRTTESSAFVLIGRRGNPATSRGFRRVFRVRSWKITVLSRSWAGPAI